MELKRYGYVLRRRWLFVLIPALVVLAVGLATYRPPGVAYNVGVRFIVGQRPSPAAAQEDEERYYNWTTSEYIVNGLTDWMRGLRFAERVSQELAAQGKNIPAGAIFGSLVADNTRSMLTISLTYPDAATLELMMAAVTAVLTEQNGDALPQLGGETAVIIPLDQPIINQVPSGLRGQLDLPIRILLGLVAGIGLALLIEYLDPTIRERDELTALGLTILGEIPRK